ncbi:protein LTO1 homolog isoform 3-T3 [Hipposideros larvatus]
MAGDQDLFDAIVMADDRFHGEGYQEGYEEGSSLGIIEGRQHGTLHGAKIGSEIGCYQGFAFAWRCLLHSRATEKDRSGCSPASPSSLFVLSWVPCTLKGRMCFPFCIGCQGTRSQICCYTKQHTGDLMAYVAESPS